ncbi:MAG: hypothetical protein GYA57_04560 [Myxococcales bacterium]|nr:hypothetical protein [Myxococcales bacterium]
MDATRASRLALSAALAAACATAGCERTPVGDESIVPREPWTGRVYPECIECDCDRTCSSGGVVAARGECTWTGEALECRCARRPLEPCEVDACASSCDALGYDGSRCDPVGCRCFRVPGAGADADAAGDATADAVEPVDVEPTETAEADLGDVSPDVLPGDAAGEAEADAAEEAAE